MGIKPSIVGLVVPTRVVVQPGRLLDLTHPGHGVHRPGYQNPLSFGDLLLVLGISLVTSKGAHGVPGSATVIPAATLNAILAIGLVLSVDWFIGMARALGNLIGNCVATVVIGALERDLDVALARRVLAGEVEVDLTASEGMAAAAE